MGIRNIGTMCYINKPSHWSKVLLLLLIGGSLSKDCVQSIKDIQIDRQTHYVMLKIQTSNRNILLSKEMTRKGKGTYCQTDYLSCYWQ